MKKKINWLQFFAEGGAGASASAGASGSESGGAAQTGVNGDSPVSQESVDDLSKVVYGKSAQTVTQSEELGEPADEPKVVDKAKTFDEMIKKGGEYAEEFNKRTQDIIDKRFKKSKQAEEMLTKQSPIMDTLARKYGIDATDVEGIMKALEDDNSMYEEAAFKEGLSVEQYKEKAKLIRENEQLRAAEERAVLEQKSNEVYANWLNESEQMTQKYSMDGFDLTSELNSNPALVQLLGNGIDFETAYKATHFDDMLGNAMATTAENTRQQLANSIGQRKARPAENGINSANNQVFKSDVNNWNDADINEVLRRVKAGEKIYL